MISIIDYGAGNLLSVQKALEFLGFTCTVTNDRSKILSSAAVILPGVGSFGDAMDSLKRNSLINTIYDCITKQTPFLGICLGMQLLFESSEESEGVTGLGIFKGKLKKIPNKIITHDTSENDDLNRQLAADCQRGLPRRSELITRMCVPHMGWNSLNLHKTDGIFNGMEQSPYVYFVHSYYLSSPDRDIVAATTKYGVDIDAAVECGNVSAVQFHPEKSGSVGLEMLKNFAKKYS